MYVCILFAYELTEVFPSPQSIVPLYNPLGLYGKLILSEGDVVFHTVINGLDTDAVGVGVGVGVIVGVFVCVGVRVNVGVGVGVVIHSWQEILYSNFKLITIFASDK